MSSLLQPDERVLSTLNADGTRRWLAPRVVEGVLYRWRRVVAWLLIAVFVALPHLHADGRQLFFINIAGGEFTLFGRTFLRTDTLLLALFGLSVFVTIFLLTALFGRVWCGWACPQTVYLEFVFRPLERLFGSKAYGPPKKGPLAKSPPAVRMALRWLTVVVVCFLLANTFLAYFDGSATLREWVIGSPFEHFAGFAFVMAVTAAMVFDFVFFREQLCIVACPYGRFQSVMLDKHSLIVGYDEKRGEPRGKVKQGKAKRAGRASPKPDLRLPIIETASNGAATSTGDGATATLAPDALGDCVDCFKCVACCPTGIDIRDGLQMECIHCAQCIDACDSVMTKLGRPTGLIRYSTQSELQTGTRRLLRPRVIFYPALLIAVLTAFTILIVTQSPASVEIIRGVGQPYNMLASGEIANQAKVVITNRTNEARAYTLSGERVDVSGVAMPVEVAPRETVTAAVLLVAPPELFIGARGRTIVDIRVTGDDGFETVVGHRMLGPSVVAPRPDSTTTGTNIQRGDTP